MIHINPSPSHIPSVHKHSVVSDRAKRNADAKTPSRILILGVCVGIGVLVVITVLAVVILRTNTRKRAGEITHRYRPYFKGLLSHYDIAGV